MKIHPATLLAAALLSFVSPARSDVKMPAIFGDHMVLQQDLQIPVWGWADPGESITVTLGHRSARVVADAAGKWRVNLEPLSMNAAPQILTVKGKNTLQFSDVLVGEVWLCSGQSNMEYQLEKSHLAKEDLPNATDAQIRLFQIPRTDRAEPQTDVAAKWVVCAPGTVRGFSAVGYYFARDLRQALRRPVGLIGSYWGGTRVQSWTSRGALEKDPAFLSYVQQAKADTEFYLANKDAYPQLLAEYQALKTQWDTEVKPGFDPVFNAWQAEAKLARAEGRPQPPRPLPVAPEPKSPRNPNPGPQRATALYNGMIAPLVPYALRGVLWYQGESNADRASEYGTLFPLLISDWREKWLRADLPFLFVQLPNFARMNPNENWVLLREAQAKAQSLPKTGMAVTIDVGHPDDIHPPDKLDIGLRLARIARHLVYGENLVWTGPIFDTMKVTANQARLSFKHGGSGLKIGASPWTPAGAAVPATELRGFLITGPTRKWLPAKARIVGNEVLVSSPQVAAPVAVRYAWTNNPDGNLYNQENLPAAPFRTDDWPHTTEALPSTTPQAVEWNQQCAERVAASQNQPCDIIFIGDSITQNFQERPKNGWNLVGRAVWDKYYAQRQVLNFGVGGDSIQNALWRMENMAIQALRPKVAVIMLGMNNASDTPEDIVAGIQAVTNKSRGMFPGVKVVIMSITANGRMPEKTARINQILPKLADGQNIFYLDIYSKMIPFGNGWQGVGGDKVHLTEEGYEIWASALEPLFTRLMGKALR